MNALAGMDWDWAVETGGNLSRRQRRSLTLKLVAELPRMVAGQVNLALGRRGTGRIDFDDLRLPDSELARAAETHARECLSAHVLEHSYRTYFFGRALCELRGTRYDNELVYVASLLHDLNLEHPTAGRCFAVTGAEQAVAFATANGATPERARAIGSAISAHLTLGTADDLGGFGFVAAGASVDVVGDRLADLDPVWVDDLLQRHPRLDFKQHVLAAIGNEAESVPGGRVRWLVTTAAFRQAIRIAPFPE